ncbi:MCP four helix bundle domain-containing protein [Wenyingzhuangia sp. IMCC45467]
MIFNKVKKVLSVLLIFFIVLSTNLVDKDNFNSLKQSVTTIYEDRIVVCDLIFETSLLIQDKEIAIVSADTLFFKNKNAKVNREIDSYIKKYEQTKLTDKERNIFDDLKTELERLYKLENNSKTPSSKKVLSSIHLIKEKLQHLSKIQLDEGKLQMHMSNKAMKTINLFTQIEIIFLIIIAILVQVIILYNPKKNNRDS